jgi:hypothetical protein
MGKVMEIYTTVKGNGLEQSYAIFITFWAAAATGKEAGDKLRKSNNRGTCLEQGFLGTGDT